MRIYDFAFAPNPRRLRVYLAEKGLEIPRIPINLVAGEQKSPEFLEINPLGSLPVLELDDGTNLSESGAIIEYLEELHPDPPMIGSDPLERARVRRLNRIAEIAVLFRVARWFHAERAVLPGAEPNPAVARWSRDELPLPLGVLDAEVGDRPFVAGPRVSVADCTLFAAFEMARMGELQIGLERYPNLSRWYAAFQQRPAASA
jgi:glutathione S-transferase